MKCCTCKNDKSEEYFAWKVAGKKRQSKCKACQKEYRRKHYLKNRQKYIDKADRHNRVNRERNIRLIVEFLIENPCVDCGETDPVVLDFDHRNPDEKSFTVSVKSSAALGWNTLKSEIDKCDVRCANCHRRRTARAQDWLRLKYSNMGG